MIYDQFMGLCKKFTKGGRYISDRFDSNGTMIMFMVGPHKGKPLLLVGIEDKRLVAKIGENETVAKHYKDCHLLDKNGEIVKYDLKDMTGRPIEVGKHIIFSVPEGNNSSSLNIGKVIGMTPSGCLRVVTLVKNGVSMPETGYGGRENSRLIDNARKMIVLPIEDGFLGLWVLNDFRDFGSN